MTSATDLPLTGIRVLDFSQYAPGPFVTRQLCDLGAEVIKIEPPDGDPMAQLFLTASGASPVYETLNRGKQIARVNLKDAGAIEAVRSLIKDADVLLEGFRPGVMDRLQLGFNAVSKLNPDLVYCSLTGYGQTGPYTKKAGHDINYCAAAGLFSYTERPALFPLVGDHSGAQNALSLIMAELIGVQRGVGRADNKARHLDVSLYEPMLGWQYLNQSGTANPDNPLAVLWGEAACYNLYSTADQRTVTLGALEPVFWRNFCEGVDRADWISQQWDPMPQTGLIAEVSNLFQSQPLSHWRSILGEVDCCFEPVPLTGEVFDHPQTVARGIFGQGDTGIAGKETSGETPNVTNDSLSITDQDPSWRS